MYKAEICKIVQDCTYKIAPGNSCFMGFMPPGVANLHQTPFDTKSFLFKRLLSCNGKYRCSKIFIIYHLFRCCITLPTNFRRKTDILDRFCIVPFHVHTIPPLPVKYVKGLFMIFFLADCPAMSFVLVC